jgi:uncharacterized membrane protein
METLTKVLLLVHVLAGSTALLAALGAITFRKGFPRHNFLGRIYFWAMMTVAATALPVSILRPNLMLFFVALFSAYMAYAGWRFGKKDRYLMNRPPYIEWGMLLVGVAMVLTGAIQIVTGNSMGWVLVAFGGIGLQFGIQDLRGWGKDEDFATRISNHLTHMLGGTIATLTAVLVQQVVPRLESGSSLAVVIWLAPTVIITPLIALWSWKVQTTKRARLFQSRPTR